MIKLLKRLHEKVTNEADTSTFQDMEGKSSSVNHKRFLMTGRSGLPCALLPLQ